MSSYEYRSGAARRVASAQRRCMSVAELAERLHVSRSLLCAETMRRHQRHREQPEASK